MKWLYSKDSLWTTELLTIPGILEQKYLVYLWTGYLIELRILSWTLPHTFINCLLGQWGGVQDKWYQGSKSCLNYLAGVVCKMYCPALVYKSKAGQGTLVSISRDIIHGTKAAALVTKSYSNQGKESTSLLLTLGQISCNVQSLPERQFEALSKFVNCKRCFRAKLLSSVVRWLEQRNLKLQSTSLQASKNLQQVQVWNSPTFWPPSPRCTVSCALPSPY